MLYKNIQSKSLTTDIRSPNTFRINTWETLYCLRLIVFVLLDVAAITLAWKIAVKLGTPVYSFYLLEQSQRQFGWLWLIVAIDLGILFASGLYGLDRKSRYLRSLIKPITLAHITLLLIAFLLGPGVWVSRSVFVSAWFLTLVFIGTERFILGKLLDVVRKKFAHLRRKVLLVGIEEDTIQARKLLENTQVFKVTNTIDLSQYSDPQSLAEAINRWQTVDEVFICSWEKIVDSTSLFWQLQSTGINWRILPIRFSIPNQWSEIGMISEVPTIRFRSSTIVGIDFLCKRIFDLIVSFSLLVLLSLPLIIIAILIKLDSPGSIFYKQVRVGLKGRHFKVWKFRTMVENASKLQDQLEASNEIEGGILFKMKNDPRITKVGKFLRSYSLDEIPQIINVLRGEMSLVGPRPLPVRDVERFSAEHFFRHEVVPGITGLWQVSGRSDTDSDGVFYWDSVYIQNWSLYLDCQIILKTIQVLLTKKGAY